MLKRIFLKLIMDIRKQKICWLNELKTSKKVMHFCLSQIICKFKKLYISITTHTLAKISAKLLFNKFIFRAYQIKSDKIFIEITEYLISYGGDDFLIK